MNYFEKFKSKIGLAAPALTKQAAASHGGYESAVNFSVDRSFIWDGGSEEDDYSREAVNDIAGYLIKNSSTLERLLSIFENYGVGAGIGITSVSTQPAFASAASRRWESWAKSTYASVSGDISFYQAQRLIIRSLISYGEVFLCLFKDANGFPQFKLVSHSQVRTGDNKEAKNGLFFDKAGRVTAFNIFFSPEVATKVPAQDVIHFKRNTEIGRNRGISAFAPALNNLRDHKDLVQLNKRLLKTHASFAAVVKKKTGSANFIPGENPAAANLTKVSRNVALEKATGGLVSYLNPDEDVSFLTSAAPGQGMLEFLKLLEKEVCLTLSIPVGFAVDPSGLTGPAIRFVLADVSRVIANMQDIMIYPGLERLYGWVIASFAKRGDLPAAPSDYFAAAYQLPLSITIDQSRRDNADAEFIKRGLLSLDSYYGAQGKNWKEQVTQAMQEKKFIAEEAARLGINPNIFLQDESQLAAEAADQPALLS